MTASLDAVLEALAAGLRRRVDEQRRAEERLASFAFVERPVPSGDHHTSPAATAWRYHIIRTLRLTGDPEILALLEILRGGARPLAELVTGGTVAGDRVAAADWIGGLSASGFVTRELETDRVTLAPLGIAVLDLVGELERLLAAAGDQPATDEQAATDEQPAPEAAR